MQYLGWEWWEPVGIFHQIVIHPNTTIANDDRKDNQNAGIEEPDPKVKTMKTEKEAKDKKEHACRSLCRVRCPTNSVRSVSDTFIFLMK